MNRKVALLSTSFLLFLSACGSPSASNTTGNKTDGTAAKSKSVKIGITQIVEHPSLDEARRGFVAALKDGGYKEGDNLKLDVQIAQGDMNNNISIAQKFVSDHDDLILAISTPSAQAAVKATKDIPVVFTAITDPLGANLVTNMEKPGGNVTGMSDTHPDEIKNSVKSIIDFYPNAKKVGIIYNAGEQNSVVNVKAAKQAMNGLGLQPVEVTVSNSSEVKQAADSLVGRVDAIAYFKDNTVASALETVIQVANQNHLPFFAGDADSVKRGVLAAYGFEEFDLGYQAGKVALDILNGKKPGDIPVGVPNKLQLYINQKTAATLGLKLSDDVKKNAVIVGQ